MGIASPGTDPKTAYRKAVSAGTLLVDQRQAEVVEHLQSLYESLVAAADAPVAKPQARGLLQRLFGEKKSATPTTSMINGLYLWGGVGRGKTLLCDMFFDSLPIERKKRTHFHRFMRNVHQQLADISHEESPLETVAERFASEFQVLVLDEMHVNDIADAMLMSGLLRGLFRRGVTVLTTSNVPPDGLYRDGLQRASFLPAIDLLQRHTDVIFLGGDVDYRMRLLANAEIYHSPLDEQCTATLKSYFIGLAGSTSHEESATVDINDRLIETVMLADGVVWFAFNALCNTARSTDDYIEIARLFHTVIVSDIAAMDDTCSDTARRFINMIDEFYDRNVKLVVTAAELPELLYQGNRLKFEFERTASRLREMQSSEYLADQHNPG
ncbi:hypothetical protein AB833_29840 [Chromatiales bacterium (ex Bugula neritina AB1)]|nr:hypothetical protein AB833_29840 [Chromatiales bacterium (ex Bugula neritina AB1)]